MSARNCIKSSFQLKHVIILYSILLFSNCTASLSLMTGKSDDKNSVNDVLQNVIMRQLTLIRDGMSKTNTDMKKDISMMKKALAQTQTDLLIMKEENKNLTEQLSKTKIDISNNKASIDQTRTRQDNMTSDINSYTKELKEMYENITRELTIRLEKQENQVVAQNKRQLQEDKVIQTLKNIISEVKENDKLKTQQLITRWKDQDDIHQSQNIILEKLHGHLKELENFKVKIDGLIATQNESQLEESKGIKKLEKLSAELNGTQKKETEELSIELKDQDAQTVSQNKTLIKVNAREDYLKNTAFGTCRDILRGCDNRSFTCRSGVYSIYVNGKSTPVWCDMETDGGGWTVIQRRQNGNVDFFRTWKEYKVGFGNVSDEYWIGNDALHVLTSSRKMKLRVDLEQFNGTKGHATFSTFAVANEANKYMLSLSGYTGDKRINDCLSHNNGRRFSTKDKDNDSTDDSCAVYKHGGWWYGLCTDANLNGRYYTSAAWSYSGVYCTQWTSNPISLKSSRMMIR